MPYAVRSIIDERIPKKLILSTEPVVILVESFLYCCVCVARLNLEQSSILVFLQWNTHITNSSITNFLIYAMTSAMQVLQYLMFRYNKSLLIKNSLAWNFWFVIMSVPLYLIRQTWLSTYHCQVCPCETLAHYP